MEEHTGSGWISHTIEVCDSHLEIERFFCGAIGGILDQTENNLIMTLAQSPQLTLVSWKVSYGGQGYAGGDVYTGETTAELLNYLQVKPLPAEKPDFAKVVEALQVLLAEPEMAAVFTLGEVTIKEWMCQVIILFRVFGEYSWPHMNKIQHLINTVETKFNMRGREVGHHIDPRTLAELGIILQFGYWHDVGYRHENEFKHS